MKFMHTADIHFDSPFATLAGKGKVCTREKIRTKESNERDGGIHKGKQYSIFFYCG